MCYVRTLELMELIVQMTWRCGNPCCAQRGKVKRRHIGSFTMCQRCGQWAMAGSSGAPGQPGRSGSSCLAGGRSSAYCVTWDLAMRGRTDVTHPYKQTYGHMRPL